MSCVQYVNVAAENDALGAQPRRRRWKRRCRLPVCTRTDRKTSEIIVSADSRSDGNERGDSGDSQQQTDKRRRPVTHKAVGRSAVVVFVLQIIYCSVMSLPTSGWRAASGGRRVTNTRANNMDTDVNVLCSVVKREVISSSKDWIYIYIYI